MSEPRFWSLQQKRPHRKRRGLLLWVSGFWLVRPMRLMLRVGAGGTAVVQPSLTVAKGVGYSQPMEWIFCHTILNVPHRDSTIRSTPHQRIHLNISATTRIEQCTNQPRKPSIAGLATGQLRSLRRTKEARIWLFNVGSSSRKHLRQHWYAPSLAPCRPGQGGYWIAVLVQAQRGWSLVLPGSIQRS